MSNNDHSTNSISLFEFKSFQEASRSILSRVSFIQVLKNWHEAYSRRQRLLYLLNYDDHILDDMGYTRQDLHSIAKLPLSTDAHQELKRLAEQRKLPRRKR